MLPLADSSFGALSLGPDPWTVTLDPFQLVPILVIGLLYARRARTLARRGRPVPRARILAFASGLGMLVVALASPVDSIGEERLLSIHMVQHILIGDIAALLLVLGVTGPLLRPVLALPVIGRLRVLAHPFVALPLWAVNLYAWHLPAAYGAALSNNVVHAAQHTCFLLAGSFMWAALVEPLPGPAWFGSGFKALYVVVVRVIEAGLANIFIWSSRPFYPHYVDAPRFHGISVMADQNTGGAILLLEGSLLTFGVLAWLFLRWINEGERAELLVAQGVDPRAAHRAVRYGRAESLGEHTQGPEPA